MLVPGDADCAVCTHPLYRVIDVLILLGFGYKEIQKEVGEQEGFDGRIREHHFNRHIREVDRETYLFLVSRYFQELRKMENRELAKSGERQSESRLKRLDAGKRWCLTAIGKEFGLDKPEKVSERSGTMLKVLEKLAAENSDLPKRIAEATRIIPAEATTVVDGEGVGIKEGTE